jgi:hypothetical protein
LCKVSPGKSFNNVPPKIRRPSAAPSAAGEALPRLSGAGVRALLLPARPLDRQKAGILGRRVRLRILVLATGAQVDRKVEALSAFGNFTIERVLVSAFPPSDELNDEGYFSAILTVEDL